MINAYEITNGTNSYSSVVSVTGSTKKISDLKASSVEELLAKLEIGGFIQSDEKKYIGDNTEEFLKIKDENLRLKRKLETIKVKLSKIAVEFCIEKDKRAEHIADKNEFKVEFGHSLADDMDIGLDEYN